MKKIITVILLISIIITIFPVGASAETPQTIEEAKTLGLDVLTRLPNAVKEVWQNQALPIFWGMWVWTKSFWDSTLGSKVRALWVKLWGLTGQETPNIGGEFQKEKDEMGKDIWERFKDLF